MVLVAAMASTSAMVTAIPLDFMSSSLPSSTRLATQTDGLKAKVLAASRVPARFRRPKVGELEAPGVRIDGLLAERRSSTAGVALLDLVDSHGREADDVEQIWSKRIRRRPTFEDLAGRVWAIDPIPLRAVHGEGQGLAYHANERQASWLTVSVEHAIDC